MKIPKPMLRKRRREAAILWSLTFVLFFGLNLFVVRLAEACGFYMGSHQSWTRGTR